MADHYDLPADLCRNVYFGQYITCFHKNSAPDLYGSCVYLWYPDCLPDDLYLLGRAKDSIIVAIVRKFILVIPLIYILPNIFRADRTNAVYMAEPVADILAVTFTAILFFFEFRKALAEISGSRKL